MLRIFLQSPQRRDYNRDEHKISLNPKFFVQKGGTVLKSYIDEDFMLHTRTAARLYHRYAEKEPIFDFHCHLSPKEILEDVKFSNISDVWLSGDHYKWRLMRACGIPEEYITGNADPYEKFLRWAQTVEKSIGNPLYIWTHLELKNYFGVTELLNSESAPAIWNICNEKLQKPEFSARNLIVKSGVKALCTTDDPADDLACHRALAADESFPVKVLPAYRPETALHPEQPNFQAWIVKLEEVCGQKAATLSELENALEKRALYFRESGCLIADQSLLSPNFTCGTREEAESAYCKALSGSQLTAAELNAYQTQLMLFLGRLYHRMGFVMQLHFGVLRNCNSRLFYRTGPDAGFDSTGDGISAASVAAFFDKLNRTDELPPTVVYSLNACDDGKLASVLGCFQEGSFPQKMQLGAPWWFSDHRDGMRKQMKTLANTGLLSGFIGMLTDSRSFLSYARHEYFRRVLCDLLGSWMEQGDIPSDESLIGEMIANICFGNSAAYFGLK